MATSFSAPHRQSARFTRVRRHRLQISSMTHADTSVVEQKLRQQALENLEERQHPALTVVPLSHHKVKYIGEYSAKRHKPLVACGHVSAVGSNCRPE